MYSNIRRYGNTSSASLLIAAAEWWQTRDKDGAASVCFAAFRAGFSGSHARGDPMIRRYSRVLFCCAHSIAAFRGHIARTLLKVTFPRS